jgi:hypothetical protein
MKQFFKDISLFFTEGWHKTVLVEKPKNFWEYFTGYSLNWLWTLSTAAWFVDFLHKQVPMFTVLSAIPFLLLIYNFVTEWNAYKKNGISGAMMAYLFYGACALDLIIVIAILFFLKTN